MELSLTSLTERINNYSEIIKEINNSAYEKFINRLSQDGVTDSNISNEYIMTDRENDVVTANNVYVKDLIVGDQSFIENDSIKFDMDNTITFGDTLLVNQKQVLSNDETCFFPYYKGIYSLYSSEDVTEILISGTYNGQDVTDLIVPFTIIEEKSSTVVGQDKFAIVIKREEEFFTIEARNKQTIITNVIIR